ncbi:MAG: GatB/YqeY domain-containing protein [Chloroflexota bacterium]
METKPGLKAKLTEDVKQAMRSGDTLKRSTLRMLLAAITNAEIARLNKPLEDADVLGVIAKEAKHRQESIEAFQKGNRPDLVAQEEAELALLQSYLPAQASHEEVVAAAKRIIAEVGAQGPGDKGKVMPRIIAELKGKADGKEINTVVTELLSA